MPTEAQQTVINILTWGSEQSPPLSLSELLLLDSNGRPLASEGSNGTPMLQNSDVDAYFEYLVETNADMPPPTSEEMSEFFWAIAEDPNSLTAAEDMQAFIDNHGWSFSPEHIMSPNSEVFNLMFSGEYGDAEHSFGIFGDPHPLFDNQASIDASRALWHRINDNIEVSQADLDRLDAYVTRASEASIYGTDDDAIDHLQDASEGHGNITQRYWMNGDQRMTDVVDGYRSSIMAATAEGLTYEERIDIIITTDRLIWQAEDRVGETGTELVSQANMLFGSYVIQAGPAAADNMEHYYTALDYMRENDGVTLIQAYAMTSSPDVITEDEARQELQQIALIGAATLLRISPEMDISDIKETISFVIADDELATSINTTVDFLMQDPVMLFPELADYLGDGASPSLDELLSNVPAGMSTAQYLENEGFDTALINSALEYENLLEARTEFDRILAIEDPAEFEREWSSFYLTEFQPTFSQYAAYDQSRDLIALGVDPNDLEAGSFQEAGYEMVRVGGTDENPEYAYHYYTEVDVVRVLTQEQANAVYGDMYVPLYEFAEELEEAAEEVANETEVAPETTEEPEAPTAGEVEDNDAGQTDSTASAGNTADDTREPAEVSQVTNDSPQAENTRLSENGDDMLNADDVITPPQQTTNTPPDSPADDDPLDTDSPPNDDMMVIDNLGEGATDISVGDETVAIEPEVIAPTDVGDEEAEPQTIETEDAGLNVAAEDAALDMAQELSETQFVEMLADNSARANLFENASPLVIAETFLRFSDEPDMLATFPADAIVGLYANTDADMTLGFMEADSPIDHLISDPRFPELLNNLTAEQLEGMWNVSVNVDGVATFPIRDRIMNDPILLEGIAANPAFTDFINDLDFQEVLSFSGEGHAERNEAFLAGIAANPNVADILTNPDFRAAIAAHPEFDGNAYLMDSAGFAQGLAQNENLTTILQNPEALEYLGGMDALLSDQGFLLGLAEGGILDDLVAAGLISSEQLHTLFANEYFVENFIENPNSHAIFAALSLPNGETPPDSTLSLQESLLNEVPRSINRDDIASIDQLDEISQSQMSNLLDQLVEEGRIPAPLRDALYENGELEGYQAQIQEILIPALIDEAVATGDWSILASFNQVIPTDHWVSVGSAFQQFGNAISFGNGNTSIADGRELEGNIDNILELLARTGASIDTNDQDEYGQFVTAILQGNEPTDAQMEEFLPQLILNAQPGDMEAISALGEQFDLVAIIAGTDMPETTREVLTHVLNNLGDMPIAVRLELNDLIEGGLLRGEFNYTDLSEFLDSYEAYLVESEETVPEVIDNLGAVSTWMQTLQQENPELYDTVNSMIGSGQTDAFSPALFFELAPYLDEPPGIADSLLGLAGYDEPYQLIEELTGQPITDEALQERIADAISDPSWIADLSPESQALLIEALNGDRAIDTALFIEIAPDLSPRAVANLLALQGYDSPVAFLEAQGVELPAGTEDIVNDVILNISTLPPHTLERLSNMDMNNMDYGVLMELGVSYINAPVELAELIESVPNAADIQSGTLSLEDYNAWRLDVEDMGLPLPPRYSEVQANPALLDEYAFTAFAAEPYGSQLDSYGFSVPGSEEGISFAQWREGVVGDGAPAEISNNFTEISAIITPPESAEAYAAWLAALPESVRESFPAPELNEEGVITDEAWANWTTEFDANAQNAVMGSTNYSQALEAEGITLLDDGGDFSSWRTENTPTIDALAIEEANAQTERDSERTLYTIALERESMAAELANAKIAEMGGIAEFFANAAKGIANGTEPWDNPIMQFIGNILMAFGSAFMPEVGIYAQLDDGVPGVDINTARYNSSGQTLEFNTPEEARVAFLEATGARINPDGTFTVEIDGQLQIITPNESVLSEETIALIEQTDPALAARIRSGEQVDLAHIMTVSPEIAHAVGNDIGRAGVVNSNINYAAFNTGNLSSEALAQLREASPDIAQALDAGEDINWQEAAANDPAVAAILQEEYYRDQNSTMADASAEQTAAYEEDQITVERSNLAQEEGLHISEDGHLAFVNENNELLQVEIDTELLLEQAGVSEELIAEIRAEQGLEEGQPIDLAQASQDHPEIAGAIELELITIRDALPDGAAIDAVTFDEPGYEAVTGWGPHMADADASSINDITTQIQSLDELTTLQERDQALVDSGNLSMQDRLELTQDIESRETEILNLTNQIDSSIEQLDDTFPGITSSVPAIETYRQPEPAPATEPSPNATAPESTEQNVATEEPDDAAPTSDDSATNTSDSTNTINGTDYDSIPLNISLLSDETLADMEAEGLLSTETLPFEFDQERVEYGPNGAYYLHEDGSVYYVTRDADGERELVQVELNTEKVLCDAGASLDLIASIREEQGLGANDPIDMYQAMQDHPDILGQTNNVSLQVENQLSNAGDESPPPVDPPVDLDTIWPNHTGVREVMTDTDVNIPGLTVTTLADGVTLESVANDHPEIAEAIVTELAPDEPEVTAEPEAEAGQEPPVEQDGPRAYADLSDVEKVIYDAYVGVNPPDLILVGDYIDNLAQPVDLANIEPESVRDAAIVLAEERGVDITPAAIPEPSPEENIDADNTTTDNDSSAVNLVDEGLALQESGITYNGNGSYNIFIDGELHTNVMLDEANLSEESVAAIAQARTEIPEGYSALAYLVGNNPDIAEQIIGELQAPYINVEPVAAPENAPLNISDVDSPAAFFSALSELGIEADQTALQNIRHVAEIQSIAEQLLTDHGITIDDDGFVIFPDVPVTQPAPEATANGVNNETPTQADQPRSPLSFQNEQAASAYLLSQHGMLVNDDGSISISVEGRGVFTYTLDDGVLPSDFIADMVNNPEAAEDIVDELITTNNAVVNAITTAGDIAPSEVDGVRSVVSGNAVLVDGYGATDLPEGADPASAAFANALLNADRIHMATETGAYLSEGGVLSFYNNENQLIQITVNTEQLLENAYRAVDPPDNITVDQYIAQIREEQGLGPDEPIDLMAIEPASVRNEVLNIIGVGEEPGIIANVLNTIAPMSMSREDILIEALQANGQLTEELREQINSGELDIAAFLASEGNESVLEDYNRITNEALDARNIDTTAITNSDDYITGLGPITEEFGVGHIRDIVEQIDDLQLELDAIEEARDGLDPNSEGYVEASEALDARELTVEEQINQIKGDIKAIAPHLNEQDLEAVYGELERAGFVGPDASLSWQPEWAEVPMATLGQLSPSVVGAAERSTEVQVGGGGGGGLLQ